MSSGTTFACATSLHSSYFTNAGLVTMPSSAAANWSGAPWYRTRWSPPSSSSSIEDTWLWRK
eukprot:15433507-Alexandrium_andersonii.AAC.1